MEEIGKVKSSYDLKLENGGIMRECKFRQPAFNDDGSFRQWHYWGFFDRDFISPYSPLIESCQYTGMKDKNNKESYHKDIIKRSGALYIMEWHDNLASWYLKPISGGWHGVTRGDMALMCGVIGNIYENPELLR